MELTLNELKILRNALDSKLKSICIVSSEFDDIQKSLQKVTNEIERIEKDIKAADEGFKAISDINAFWKGFLDAYDNDLTKNVKTIDCSLDNLLQTIDAIDSFEYSSGSEPFIKLEVGYIMLKDGELETLLAFKDKNKNCVITFK